MTDDPHTSSHVERVWPRRWLDDHRQIVVSGASGSGKTTLCRALALVPGYRNIVKYTDRPCRPGEADQVDYHFVAPGWFQGAMHLDELVCYAFRYGHQYAVTTASLATAISGSATPVLILDPHLAIMYCRQYPRSRSIFVGPHLSEEVVEELTRHEENYPDVKQRAQMVAEELSLGASFDVRVRTPFDVPAVVETITRNGP